MFCCLLTSSLGERKVIQSCEEDYCGCGWFCHWGGWNCVYRIIHNGEICFVIKDSYNNKRNSLVFNLQQYSLQMRLRQWLHYDAWHFHFHLSIKTLDGIWGIVYLSVAVINGQIRSFLFCSVRKDISTVSTMAEVRGHTQTQFQLNFNYKIWSTVKPHYNQPEKGTKRRQSNTNNQQYKDLYTSQWLPKAIIKARRAAQILHNTQHAGRTPCCYATQGT